MIRADQKYRNIGIPGQDPESLAHHDLIVIDYLSDGGQLNCRRLHMNEPLKNGEPQFEFVSIGASNFIAAVDAGWFVLVE